MDCAYNYRCPAVKRLLREAQELRDPTEEYYTQPLEDNLFEWHFTVRGPPETDFEGGVYHGRIILPSEYPMKPPNIIFLTANGRFETNKKICLSISGHHPETWQPSWSIRTALLAIIGFMPTSALGTLGSLDYTAAERKKLSQKSLIYECPNCGITTKLLRERTGKNASLQEEAKEISAQMVVISKKEENGTEASENSLTQSSIHDFPNDPVSPNNNNEHIPLSRPSSQVTPELPTVPMNNISNQTSLLSSSQNQSSRSRATSPSGISLANDLILSAAIFLLVALVLRRLFLMEADSLDEIEDALI